MSERKEPHPNLMRVGEEEMVKERHENVHSLSNEIFPLAALRNPGYQVPPHLLEMAEEENRRLQQRRYSRVHTHINEDCILQCFAAICVYVCTLL